MATNTNTIFLNNIKSAFIKEASFVGANGAKKYNVSIPIDKTVSASGYLTLVVSERQIFDVKKRDGGVIAGLKNILLGDEEGTIVVSTTRDAEAIMGDDGKAHIRYSYDKWETVPGLICELKDAADTVYRNRNASDAVKAVSETEFKEVSEKLAAGFTPYDSEAAKARYAATQDTNAAELADAKAEIEALRAKLAERDGTAENPFA